MPYWLGLCVLRTHIECKFCNPIVVIFASLNIAIIIMQAKSPQIQSDKDNLEMDILEWAKQGMTPAFSRKKYEQGLQRVRALLGLPPIPNISPNNALLHTEAQMSLSSAEQLSILLSMLTKYGLGTKRSLDHLIEFTGVDLRYIYIYMYICIDIYINIHIHICIYIHLHIYVYREVYIFTYKYICTYIGVGRSSAIGVSS
jgi:hypothetical protein